MDRMDGMGAGGVKTVYLRVPLRGTASVLEFVEYHDGTLAAHRDGVPVDGQRWPVTDFGDGLHAFTELQRQIERDAPA